MAQYPGVRPAVSTHRCTWDGRSLPTLCSLFDPLDPTKTPWRPKAQDNIPPEHPKGVFAFRLSLPPWVPGQLPKGAKSKDQFMTKSLNESTTQAPHVNNVHFKDGIVEARSNASQKAKQKAFLLIR